MRKIENQIVSRFAKSQDALVLQQSDLSLQSISDMVDSNAIDVSPKYQRRERWDEDKESSLIESFLLNIPVPPIYLAEDEYGTYSVIDGKQRVVAINKFLNNKLKLQNLDKFTQLENFTFKSLPSPLMNALKIRPYLRVVTLLRQSDNDLKHEVFLRLNKAGVALNSQEIRNVAFRGLFNDMLFELSENAYLSTQLKATKQSKVYREMVDVQYVLRFFTVRESWKNFPGNMDLAMDSFMSKYYRSDKKTINTYKNEFNNAIQFCEKIWGDDGFMRPDGNRRVLQGFFDIQMICSTFLNATERNNAIRSKNKVKNALISVLHKDKAFNDSVTEFTSNPSNVKYRIEKFTEILRGI